MKIYPVIFIVLSLTAVYSQTNRVNNDLEYYPLKTGNYFEYKTYSWDFPYPGDSSAYIIKVGIDTTLDNGKQYKKLQRNTYPLNGYSSFTFERIDSLTGSVYRYNNNQSYKDNEYMIDSLFAQTGDTIRCSWEGISSFGYFRTICNSIQYVTVLGFPTEIKEFFDRSFIPGLSYRLAKGIGFYYSESCEFSCGMTKLVYAEINGKIYGKSITSVDKMESLISSNYKLYQNYPNPFNPATTISYDIPVFSHVKILVYNSLGQTIRTLLDKYDSPGNHKIIFNAGNLASGVYYYQLLTEGKVFTKKLLLIK